LILATLTSKERQATVHACSNAFFGMRRTESFKNFDSPFEAAVAEAIESFGYKADTQVGSAGFKVDLAVRDPSKSGRYMLAIEYDGATYHAALWARERDRLRQQILEGLGWRFHRIWSADWFYRRAREMEKLKQVLDTARAEEIPALPTLLTPPETTTGCVQRRTSKLPKQRANRQSKCLDHVNKRCGAPPVKVEGEPPRPGSR
jgi:very-short-patch-repair endonuclease